MKSGNLLNLKDISDSTEKFSEKPKKTQILFAYILISLLLASMAFMYFGKIDEYVKASGIVRPAEAVSEIVAPVSGKITYINLTAGTHIKKGDILLKTDNSQYSSQINSLNEQKKVAETAISNYEKLKRSISEDKNLFDESNSDEALYYTLFQQYEANIQNARKQSENTHTEWEINLSNYKFSLEESKLKLDSLSNEKKQILQLSDSIEKEENLLNSDFENYALYKLKFDSFMLDIKQYKEQISIKRKALESAETFVSDEQISEPDLELYKSELDAAEYQLEKYKTGTLIEVRQSLSQVLSSIAECENTIKGTEKIIAIYWKAEPISQTQSESVKNETLIGIDKEINSINVQLENIKTQLADAAFYSSNTEIKSPIDGVVEPYYSANTGAFVNSGTKLASVVPFSTANTAKITLYIPSAKISDVYSGQEIKLRFTSLPYDEYGEYRAKISNIAADSRQDSNSGVNYYVVEAEFDTRQISDEKIELIKNGMDCEAHVITKQQRILRWVLRKLNFLEE